MQLFKFNRRAAIFSRRNGSVSVVFCTNLQGVKLSVHPLRLLPTLVAWLVLAVVLLVIVPMAYPITLPNEYHLYHFALFCLLVVLYYANVRYFIPGIYRRHGTAWYLCILVLAGGVSVFLMLYIESTLNIRQLIHAKLNPSEPYVEKPNIFIYLYLLVLLSATLLAGIVSEMLRRANREEKRSMLLRDQKSRAELRTLKAQIQPHFFFNTLNTIYALSHSDVPQAQQALLKLSKMMRFAMNEENRERVKLQEEIGFVADYLDLMRHRLPLNVTLTTSTNVDSDTEEIIPMVLPTFIENCFKHGITTERPCSIHISLELKDGALTLLTKNTINSALPKNEGIGVSNTLKRLDIIYGDRYRYHVTLDETNYTCNLTIQL